MPSTTPPTYYQPNTAPSLLPTLVLFLMPPASSTGSVFTSSWFHFPPPLPSCLSFCPKGTSSFYAAEERESKTTEQTTTTRGITGRWAKRGGGQRRKGKEEVLVLEGEEGPVAAFVLFLSLSSHFRPPTNRPMDGGAFLFLPPTVGSRGFGRARAV